MGVGIAYVFAQHGHEVVVAERDGARAAALVAEVADAAAAGTRRGKLTETEAAELCARITVVAQVDDLPTGLDVIIESVPERLDLKHAILTAAEARAPQLLASNTSSLSIGSLAGPLTRPEMFLGMHFFNPVWSIGLVEIVLGSGTAERARARAAAIVSAIGKTAIEVADTPGFATSRLDVAYALEAMRMVEAGVATPADIDRGVELAYRHPMGPLRLSDLVGLDVRLDIARHLAAELGPRFAPPAILERKVAAGDLGVKSGRGFYDWADA
jgi:3-hydroxybutyryl-CoA dehydrogenase